MLGFKFSQGLWKPLLPIQMGLALVGSPLAKDLHESLPVLDSVSALYQTDIVHYEKDIEGLTS